MRAAPAPSLETRSDFVVPAGIDDPARPSGGNAYDRRLIDALRARGWEVELRHDLAGPADGAVVVVDGLVAATDPGAVLDLAARARVVLLLHMEFGELGPVLGSVASVVTTSESTRQWAVTAGAPPERVVVAPPGVDPAPVAAPASAGDLLCLAAVTRGKGHDVLLTALAELSDLDWTCTCVGALDLEPGFVDGLRELALRSGIGDRVLFPGARTGDELEATLGRTGLLVSASRREAYGMAVVEALARGVPVIVTQVGGHPEAVDGGGVLVPPDDPDALAAALRRWLTDPAERERLRSAAAGRRTRLAGWDATADRFVAALNQIVPGSVTTS